MIVKSQEIPNQNGLYSWITVSAEVQNPLYLNVLSGKGDGLLLPRRRVPVNCSVKG